MSNEKLAKRRSKCPCIDMISSKAGNDKHCLLYYFEIIKASVFLIYFITVNFFWITP